MTGSLTGPSVLSAALDLQLADYHPVCARCDHWCVPGTEAHPPPCDQQQAATFAARLRAEKPEISDHRIADRLTESGFHTKSGVGVWHAGRAKALLETATSNNARRL